MSNSMFSKIDPLLLASTEADSLTLERSEMLSFGYNFSEKRWEIIVKYIGDFSAIASLFPDGSPTELLGGYALFRLTREELDFLSQIPQIIYIEKPKRIFFEVQSSKRESCISNLPVERLGTLTGKEVAIAVIDSGIDYMHPDFRNEDGSTRISYLWDQTIPPDPALQFFPPAGYSLGTLFIKSQIDAAISAPDLSSRNALCPSTDPSGHGTHVAGIAAGNGAASKGRLQGVAPNSPLWIMKLGSPSPNGFPSTSQLMQAVDFCVRTSMEKQVPLVINLSFGNTYGSHSGTSLLETYLDEVAQMGQISIVIGTGNEAANGGHVSGSASSLSPEKVEFVIADYQTGLSIQIWKNYWNELSFFLEGPASLSGTSPILLSNIPGTWQYQIGSTNLLVYVGAPSPYNLFQEIYLDFLPADSYLDAGVWRIVVRGGNEKNGTWEMWMPALSARNRATRFLISTPETTLTIPSTARLPISVGAYDGISSSLAPFSGRGYTWNYQLIKPDLVAPGVDITSCAPGGGYSTRSGTSMAAPFVSGSCALLMEWGIINQNDPFLYGQKLKSYLIFGAKRLPFANEYPNPLTGWGALCLRDSFPNP